MTREVAHQKMFEAALDSITSNFPPGTLPGNEQLGHVYLPTSDGYGEGQTTESSPGFEFAEANSEWGFKLDTDTVGNSSDQVIL